MVTASFLVLPTSESAKLSPLVTCYRGSVARILLLVEDQGVGFASRSALGEEVAGPSTIRWTAHGVHVCLISIYRVDMPDVDLQRKWKIPNQ